MNLERLLARRGGLLPLAAAFLLSTATALAAGLPDPLGLRASCVTAPPAEPQYFEAWLVNGDAGAAGVAFLTTAINATVRLETASCEKDMCDELRTTGTGVAVSADGLVLTAFHVIRDVNLIKATFRTMNADGYVTLTTRTVSAKVVAVAPDKDVALLRLTAGADYPHMPIDCRWQAPKKAPVWHFGQKSGWEYGRVTMQSTVSVEIADVYETDAQARPGDSGAPFIKPTGELIGILLSKNGTGKSYYMPVADAIAALERAAAAK